MLRALPRRAAVVSVALAALTVSCATTTPEPHRPAAGAPATPSVPAGDAVAPAETPDAPPAGAAGAAGESGVSGEPGAPDAMTPGPERVRDAFAGLQATLNDSCADPGNCSYFLGRVYEELHGMDQAMKADAKGPGHFTEPIAWIKELDAKLGTDTGFENLKKHQKLLISTRDKINTWMQGHPDDYR